MTTKEGVQYLVAQLNSIRSKQFDLVYYGKFSYDDTREMTLTELDWFYNKLLETKKSEKEAHDKAVEEASKLSKIPRINVPRAHRKRR